MKDSGSEAVLLEPATPIQTKYQTATVRHITLDPRSDGPRISLPREAPYWVGSHLGTPANTVVVLAQANDLRRCRRGFQGFSQ